MQEVYWGGGLRAGGRDGGMRKREGDIVNTKLHWLPPWTARAPLVLGPAGAFWGVSNRPCRIHTNRDIWIPSLGEVCPQKCITTSHTHTLLGYICLRIGFFQCSMLRTWRRSRTESKRCMHKSQWISVSTKWLEVPMELLHEAVVRWNNRGNWYDGL